MTEKRNVDLSALFGQVTAALCGDAQDRGALFHPSDAADLRAGASMIPGEVTMSRRRGEVVTFDPATTTWTFPDGKEVT